MGNKISFKIGNSNNSALPPQDAGQIIFDKGTSSILVDVDKDHRQAFSQLGGWAANKILGTDDEGNIAPQDFTFDGAHLPASGKLSHYVKCYSSADDIIKYIDNPGIELEEGTELFLELVNGHANVGIGLIVGNSFPLGLYFGDDFDARPKLPAGTVLHLIYKNFSQPVEPRALTQEEIEEYFNIYFNNGITYENVEYNVQTNDGAIVGDITFNNVTIDQGVYPRPDGDQDATETSIGYQDIIGLNLDIFDEEKTYFARESASTLDAGFGNSVKNNERVFGVYIDSMSYDETYTLKIFVTGLKKGYALNGFTALNTQPMVLGGKTVVESGTSSYLNHLIAQSYEFSFNTGYDLLGVHSNRSSLQDLVEAPQSLKGNDSSLGVKYNNGKLYANEIGVDKATIYGYCTSFLSGYSPTLYFVAGSETDSTQHSFQMRFDVNATDATSPIMTLTQSRATVYNWQVKRANNTTATASLTINGFSNPSDKTIKENFEDLQLDSVFDALKPIAYNFIGDTKKNIGFAAQDVEKAFNDNGFVGSDYGVLQMPASEDDLYGLNYSQIIALNTDQIQKLKARVRELEDQLNDLTVRMLIEESKGG